MTLETIASIDWSAIWGIITTITTAVAGLIAGVQAKLKQDAKAETQAVQAFFDPDDNSAMTPTSTTPDRSWKMSEITKACILTGKTDADRVKIIEQINKAESAGYVDYTIVWSGGNYNITYGLIESSYQTVTIERTSKEEIADWYLNTFGITKSYYSALYEQWKAQTVERYRDEESFQRWLSNAKETEDNWGIGPDGTKGVSNMVGNSGVSQMYYDAYVACLRYRD